MKKSAKEIAQENIKALIKKRGNTLEDVAVGTGYEDKGTISKHLNPNGRSNALEQIETLGVYAEYFGVNRMDLIKENMMMLRKNPAPDRRIEQNLWHIFFNTVRQEIMLYVLAYNSDSKKEEDLFGQEIRVVENTMFNLSTLVETVILCLNIKECERPLTEKEVAFEKRYAESCKENDRVYTEVKSVTYYEVNDKVFELEDLYTTIYETCELYAKGIYFGRIDKNQGVLACAKDLYLTIMDK